MYDPYIVLSGPAAASPTHPSPDLQAAIEAAVAGGAGDGTGGTLAGSELAFCGVLSIDGGGGGGDDDGDEMGEWERVESEHGPR